MLIVYSSLQRRHRPTYVVKGGHHSQSYDLPERLDSILSVVKQNELGAIVEPACSGLAPILAVHDAGMIEHLLMPVRSPFVQLPIETAAQTL
jgi:hypothetical protein